jgi:ATP-dependent DNA ligase
MNYALEWKKFVNFKELKFENFIAEFHSSHAFYLEKLDGMLGALVFNKGNDPYFQTTTGKEIKDLPLLEEYKSVLNSLGIKSCVLIGELVGVRNGKELRFNESMSIIKTSRLEKNKTLIHHFLYDVFYLDGSKNVDFSNSIKFLKNNFWNKKFNYIQFPKMSSDGIDNFEKLYRECIPKPYTDGIVVRSKKGNFKVKPFNSVDLCVISIGNENMVTWSRNQISYVVTAFMDKQNDFRITGRVGTGFTHKERSEFFEFCEKNKVDKTEKGDFLVKPKLIVEVQYRNFYLQDMSCFKFEKGKYIYEGKKKSVSLIMPSFLRIREDKKVNNFDLRLEQILDFKY